MVASKIVLVVFVFSLFSHVASASQELEPYTPARVQSTKAGKPNVPEGNISVIVEKLQSGASSGDPEAQYALGVLHAVGWGVPKSTAHSILYYSAASMGGDVDASMALGYRHENGYGVEKNCEMSVRYYWTAAKSVVDAHHGGVVPLVEWPRLAAENNERKELQQSMFEYRLLQSVSGEAKAQLSTGYAYMFGLHGQNQDAAKAEKHFLAAARGGEHAAFGALGQLYSRGAGGAERNITKALEYFLAGANYGDISSLNGMGLHYAQGLGVEKDLQKAIKYFSISAKNGNPEANYNLGMMYLGGVGVVKDIDKAKTHLAVASQRGQAMARFRLGEMYMRGQSMDKSCLQAVKFFKTIAQEGPRTRRIPESYDLYVSTKDVTSSLYGFLLAAETGIEVAESNAAHVLDSYVSSDFPPALIQEAAMTYYLRAGSQGSKHALVRVADLTSKSHPDAALQHYREAEMKRSSRAAFSLGYMYHMGDGVPVDYDMAKRYYDNAVEYDPYSMIPVEIMKTHMVWKNYTKDKTMGDVWSDGVRWVNEEIVEVFGTSLENIVLASLILSLTILLYVRWCWRVT